jgi:hypothetical protein
MGKRKSLRYEVLSKVFISHIHSIMMFRLDLVSFTIFHRQTQLRKGKGSSHGQLPLAKRRLNRLGILGFQNNSTRYTVGIPLLFSYYT